ncbi:hypothetical protein Y1Q_0007181 [Alligator mississippiensis]|uniref:Uncharacterized protein n=1 Tax=Alligator mississippiensis TaxID=8496 RepID=A0A151N5U3_ALLMI|nr:hypothetical protein Y1Q_0007181 [Alligator mississippiensis]
MEDLVAPSMGDNGNADSVRYLSRRIKFPNLVIHPRDIPVYLDDSNKASKKITPVSRGKMLLPLLTRSDSGHCSIQGLMPSAVVPIAPWLHVAMMGEARNKWHMKTHRNAIVKRYWMQLKEKPRKINTSPDCPYLLYEKLRLIKP